MHKTLLLFFLLLSAGVFSQNEDNIAVEEIVESHEIYYDNDYTNFNNDTIVYNKTNAYSKKRSFDANLSNKYSGEEFEYIDTVEKPKTQENKPIDTKNADLFLSFMANIFPYLLGFIVVLIVIKSFVNIEVGFWKFGKFSKKVTQKLVYEDDENIDENDYEKLLSKAIKNNDYRLATRYHYLSILKKLSQKELITYHKDKTNTEYQFELKDEQMRSKFSYLAYIYDYVWYGEFPVDKVKFDTIEKKYKSFYTFI